MKKLLYKLLLLNICLSSVIAQKIDFSLADADHISNSLRKLGADEIKESKVIVEDLNNKIHEFNIYESTVLPEALRIKFPNIINYSGYSLKNPSEKISITKFNNDLFISLHLADHTVRIRRDKQTNTYVKYKEESSSNLTNDYVEMNTKDFGSELMNNCIGAEEPCYNIGDNLFVYRIGMILSKEANSEVANGTISGGLAWVSDMVNRVNLVWIRDLGSKLILADNSDFLIMTDSNLGYFPSPPHPSPTHFLLQYIQPMLDDVIGENTYEYGHLVTTGVGGGWAALSSQKGVSDPSYEVIVHEIGHQLGSSHNITEEDARNAWSIGGTIMGYRDKTAPNGDGIEHGDQYSSHTVELAIDRQRKISNGFAGGFYNEPSGNSIPVITQITESGKTIPVGTPFILNGKAEDTDLDILTYTWEQNDRSNKSFNIPDFPSESGPLFVTVFPSTKGNKRYFPNLIDLAQNKYLYREQLPFSSRELNFRLIVRDNNPECGAYTYKNVTLFCDGNSGPFYIKNMNSNDIFTSGAEILLEWEVANTDLPPVNCRSVTILLSDDNGASYNYVLKENTQNDGSELVKFPELIGTNFRVMIKAVDNIFFDINDSPITLHDPQTPGLVVDISKRIIKVDDQDTENIEVDTRSLGSISDSILTTIIEYPEEIICQFQNGDIVIKTEANATNNLNIEGLSNLPMGKFEVTLKFDSENYSAKETIEIIKIGKVFDNAGSALNLKSSQNQNVLIPSIGIKTNEITFAGWIYIDKIQDPYSAIFCSDGSNETAALNFINNNHLGYHWEGGDYSWNSGLKVNEGEWSFVCLVTSQNGVTLYLNGKKASHSFDAREIDFSEGLRFGSYKNWNGRNFDGLIDEVSIWNKSLSSDEVLSMMHKTLTGIENNLISYYQFNRRNLVDAVGGFNGNSNNNDLEYLESQVIVGDSETQYNFEQEGLVEFKEVGVSVDYSTQNGSMVVITKMNEIPLGIEGIPEDYEILNEQYWLYQRNSVAGIYLGDIIFEVENLKLNSDYTNADEYSLFSREYGSNSGWKEIKTAVELIVAEQKIKFQSLFSTGQFLIAKKKRITSVENESLFPNELKLYNNYPNPFNPNTIIKFGLPNKTKVKLEIFDVLGNKVSTIVNSELNSGYYQYRWEAKNDLGEGLSSGLYIYKLSTAENKISKKMIFIK